MSDMINEEEKIGKISIADGVVASIAGIAAIEVVGTGCGEGSRQSHDRLQRRSV